MKGVILAAGRGVRFGSEKPKVLARLLGRSLLEHGINTLKKAGISESDIIVVYSDPRVKEALSRYPGVNTVYNEAVERGNGYSLLKAKQYVGNDRFILLMGDHFMEAEGVRKLLSMQERLSRNGTIHLAVERNLDDRDVEEATKVLLREGRVADIGKEIRRFNAIDAGLFLCSPKIFDIAESFTGSFSLNDVMKKASEKGVLLPWDITGYKWADIDTVEDLKQAESEILRGLTKETDGIISRHINRRISTRITRLLLGTSVSPNQISFFSFLLSVASGGLFMLHHPAVAGVMAQISSIIDGCDGEIARLKGATSRFGAYFDSLLDRYGDFAILLGMIMVDPLEYWLPGVFAILGSYSISYSAARAEALTKAGFKSWKDNLMSRDMRLFVIMLGGLTNQVLLTLYLLAVATNVVVLSRLATIKTRIQEKHPQR
jgi:CDP-L-myo-inositol myo-inositolphosphotransferase